MVKSVRQSNIELLRIIAMTFIVIGHIVFHGTHNSIGGSVIIKTITATGVDLFVMISGYFGIKLSFRSFLNILGIVLFYSFLSMILCALIFKQSFAIMEVVRAFFPMSLGTYWFVSCYMMLMLLSPAINIVLEKTSNLQYLVILSVIAYMLCVSGWIFGKSNCHGYSTFNMIFIYFIGHGIRRFNLHKYLKKYIWLVLYIIWTILLNVMFFYVHERTLTNNSPVLIIAAILLFCFVLNFKFQNNSINRIAVCMFPVFLIQDGYVGQKLYGILYEKGLEYSFTGGYYAIIAGYFILLFLTAIIVEHLRMKIMNKPIIALSDFVSDKVGRIVEKINVFCNHMI